MQNQTEGAVEPEGFIGRGKLIQRDYNVRGMFAQHESMMMECPVLALDEGWTHCQIRHRASTGLRYCLVGLDGHDDISVLQWPQSWDL